MLEGNQTADEVKDQPGSEEEKPLVLHKLKVVDEDGATGKLTKKEIEVDDDEYRNLAQQGYRYAQKAGAMNAATLRLAKELAEPIAAKRAIEIMGEMRKRVPDVKQPTAEELQDPEVMAKYVSDLEKRITDRIENEFSRREKDKAEQDTLLARYNTEIDDALKAFPKVPRSLLIKVIKADQTDIADIHETARDLHQQISGSVDLEDLPEDKRKSVIEGYIKKSKAPPPPPEGTKNKNKERPRTFADLRKQIEKNSG